MTNDVLPWLCARLLSQSSSCTSCNWTSRASRSCIRTLDRPCRRMETSKTKSHGGYRDQTTCQKDADGMRCCLLESVVNREMCVASSRAVAHRKNLVRTFRCRSGEMRPGNDDLVEDKTIQWHEVSSCKIVRNCSLQSALDRFVAVQSTWIDLTTYDSAINQLNINGN